MADTTKSPIEAFHEGIDSLFGEKIDAVSDVLAKQYEEDASVAHVIERPMPSETTAKRILDILLELLFLGYYGDQDKPRSDIAGRVREDCNELYELLSAEVAKSHRHACTELRKPCCHCRGKGCATAIQFMEGIYDLREALKLDVQAAFDGDPAAKSLDEIIFSYPGLRAIAVHRIAHALHLLSVPVLPRIMSEYAHRETGIDIHPGARIGQRFFIDHGTGVVIGETTTIGANCRFYHGVTLGAFSVGSDEVEELRSKKRHPTIEDDVIIYPNATILGGETVIGRGCVIGGNVWITQSVAPDTMVTIETPQLRYKNKEEI